MEAEKTVKVLSKEELEELKYNVFYELGLNWELDNEAQLVPFLKFVSDQLHRILLEQRIRESCHGPKRKTFINNTPIEIDDLSAMNKDIDFSFAEYLVKSGLVYFTHLAAGQYGYLLFISKDGLSFMKNLESYLFQIELKRIFKSRTKKEL